MEKIYPYAVAKIKAKENNMLNQNQLEQLATEKDIKKIISILEEKGYDFGIISRYEEFDKTLKKEEEKLYKLIKELVEENEFLEIFLSPIDYNNVKVILKSKIQEKPYKENIVEGGLIKDYNIINIMENKEYDKLDENIKNAINDAISAYEEVQMPYIIDAILDKMCFLNLKQKAEKIGNEFIKKYIEKMIDSINIKTFFRVRNIYKNYEIFKTSYISGGRISLITYEKNFFEEDQNLKGKFVGFSEIIEQAIYDYSKLDIYFDNYIMSYMKEAKLKSLSIEPIVAYIYAKQTEIKNIRIILTGKIAKISSEKIKERLRESYV